MQYLITFLEGMISFLSPCMLPMLPLYVSYFAAGGEGKEKTLRHAVGFVAGFTLVFVALGAFAGAAGALLAGRRRLVELAGGVVVIVLGLGYLEVIPLSFWKGMGQARKIKGLVSAFLFGTVYAVSLTPCVGAFLGSALALASASGTAGQGMLLLLIYSLGLGIPFLVSALLLERLGTVFGWIKSHYGIINRICGMFLILVGLLMATGMLNRLMALFS